MASEHERTEELRSTLLSLAVERLTLRQKMVLVYLSKNSTPRSSTALVENLESVLQCSRSTLWNNLRSLRRARLLEEPASDATRHVPRLTRVGAEVGQHLVEHTAFNLGGGQ